MTQPGAFDFSANVSLWLNCNLKCPYCFGTPLKPPSTWPEETENQLRALEKFFNSTGTWELDFSGGEVTIYPGFGDFCRRLAAQGHQVMFYCNGVKDLAEVFPDRSAESLKRVTFSYQLAQEKSGALDRMFEKNVLFLQENGVEVHVNYVLYPERKDTAAAVRRRMENLGVDLQFRAFQGDHEGKQYPFAYSRQEVDDFAAVGDIRALFLMQEGSFTPTFKKCRAGYETFYISLRTGGVYTCEQLQQMELANFYLDSAQADFQKNLLSRPINCPAKRCTCRITVEQESFLAENDPWDMANFPAWREISLPTPRATEYWEKKERDFADELAGRLQGDQVYFWGGGVHTLILLKLLKERGFPLSSVRGIIDSNPFKHGQEILGLTIVSGDSVSWRDGKNCTDIIISSRAFEEEIYQQINGEKSAKVNLIRLYDGSLKNSHEALEE